MKAAFLFLALAMCLRLRAADERQSSTVLIEMKDFTTSVKRQLEESGVLKAFETSKKITVQLVWSDEEAAPHGEIAEERIQSRSATLELHSAQRALLFKALSETSDYRESIASCMCEFQPQLRVAFYSGTPEVRYDILLSGVSHGEVQAFRDKQLKAYARTSHFVAAYLNFLDAIFPEHELTTMLHQFHKNRKGANQSTEPTPPSVTAPAEQEPRRP
jgi:hypothetical protein